jgi:SSS family solute:Na+ symporter
MSYFSFMDPIALLAFISITGGIALISWLQTRKEKLNTLSGLFFANRNLGFITVGSGVLFANINTALFIGENELTFTNNMSVMAWGVTSVFAMLVVSEFIMPIYLRHEIATTPDYLENRYDRKTKVIVSLIFLVNYIVNLLPSVLYSGAVAFNGIFRFSEIYKVDYWLVIWVLVWCLGIAGALYSLLGGLKAISVSDTLLGFAMFTGGLLLPLYALCELGEGNLVNGWNMVTTYKTSHWNSIGGPADAIPFATIFTGMLLVNLYYWGTEQYIVQQLLGSRDLASCQKGIALACVGKLLCPLLINIPGVIAVQMYSRMSNTAEVFPKLLGDVSPPFYTGFMAALLFGAAFTTFNAGLNSSSTLFMLNLYKPWSLKKGRKLSETQLVRTAKRFEIILCLAAMFIAPFILFASRGFYTYVQTVGGLFSVPIFTILVVGLLTRRVPPIAARIGLVFFICSYAIAEFVLEIKLHFLHVLAILFVLTAALMLLIGRLHPLSIPYQPNKAIKQELTPWKNRHWVALVLLLALVGMYVIFSPVGLAR